MSVKVTRAEDYIDPLTFDYSTLSARVAFISKTTPHLTELTGPS